MTITLLKEHIYMITEQQRFLRVLPTTWQQKPAGSAM